MKLNSILLVMKDPQKIISVLYKVLNEYGIILYKANSGIAGIVKFIECLPTMIIIDSHLPDLNGLSFTAIIKNTKGGNNTAIYIFNVDRYMQNTNADYFLPELNEKSTECLYMQVKSFFDKKTLYEKHAEELERAKATQDGFLPERVETNTFCVDNVYSPFSELSGDGLDYWTGEDKRGLYGLLFDCTGHDIVSFLQVNEIRALLKKGCKFYQKGVHKDLATIIQNTNEDLFIVHNDDTICTAAIVFYFDFNKNILHYCSAGIPNFYVKYKNEQEPKEIKMQNYLIGYDPDVNFEEKSIELTNVDEVIFSSDGFSELLFKNEKDIQSAKHDDVSAILVKIKRT